MSGGSNPNADDGARFEGNHAGGTESNPACDAARGAAHTHTMRAAPFLIGAGDLLGFGSSCALRGA